MRGHPACVTLVSDTRSCCCLLGHELSLSLTSVLPSLWSLTKLFGISIRGLSAASFKHDHPLISKTYSYRCVWGGYHDTMESPQGSWMSLALHVGRSWCNMNCVTFFFFFYYCVIQGLLQCGVSMLVCCVDLALVAGADLPQCELYGMGSCVTLSHWWPPYLVQSAAKVPGVRIWLGWLSMASTQ